MKKQMSKEEWCIKLKEDIEYGWENFSPEFTIGMMEAMKIGYMVKAYRQILEDSNEKTKTERTHIRRR